MQKEENRKSWEEVLEIFLEDYKGREEVIGAILCGSYATGNYTNNSDIDVHIFTTETGQKERGIRLIDGVLVEYFINPLSQSYKYLEDDFKNSRRLADANMYGNGKILFDKTGAIAKLKCKSLEYYNMPFDTPLESRILLNNYACWDMMDEIDDKIKRGETYDFIYFLLVKELISNYYYKNSIATVPFTKIERIYKDEEYRKKYHLKNAPSDEFMSLVLDTIDNKSYTSLKRLYDYVLGDFKITDFSLETKISGK